MSRKTFNGEHQKREDPGVVVTHFVTASVTQWFLN